MTTFPNSPRLLKGAIVTLSKTGNEVESTIAFQYNPQSLSRTLSARVDTGDEKSKAESKKLWGQPREEISLSIIIDATDQLEKAKDANDVACQLGIHPQLAALELLIYRDSEGLRVTNNRASQGSLEVTPPELPLTLLVWGQKRVLPVSLTRFSIQEEMHDVNLNPIYAKVDLSLDVINSDDVRWNDRSAKLYLAHQTSKERMALKGYARDGAKLTGVNQRRFFQ
jgi:Contractile injection system tube protein